MVGFETQADEKEGEDQKTVKSVQANPRRPLGPPERTRTLHSNHCTDALPQGDEELYIWLSGWQIK